MTTPKQYNILTFPQKLKLIDFLRGSSYQDGTTANQIADDATQFTGFKVTSYNIKSTAEAAGIALPLPRVPKVDPLDELRAAIITLEHRVEALETQLSANTAVDESVHQKWVDACNAASNWPAGSDQPA